MWAVINASGSINRSSGTTSAGHLGTGNYEVIFNKDVSKCVYLANVGSTATGTPGAFYATVGGRAGNANGVEVTTFTATGVAADEPFHLAVFC